MSRDLVPTNNAPVAKGPALHRAGAFPKTTNRNEINMQKLVEALKRKEREDAAKPKETAETFRAKFAEIYGPKKNPRIGTQNGPGAGSEDGDGGNADGNNARTGQDAPGAVTPTGTPPDARKPVQVNFDTNPGDPGRDGDETGPENAPERLPDDGEVPPDPSRTRQDEPGERGAAGTGNHTPAAPKPSRGRKTGNGKGSGRAGAKRKGKRRP